MRYTLSEKYIGFIAILAIQLSNVKASLAAAPLNDTLPISLVDNRVFVDTNVNDRGPFAFMVDTGAPENVISPRLVQQMALKVFSAESGKNEAGAGSYSYSKIGGASATVGKATIALPNASSTDLTQLSNVIGFSHFDGILGAEVFQNHIVTIDATGLKLTIESPSGFKPDSDAIGIPFTFQAGDKETETYGMPLVIGSINGLSATFEVDTGDRSSLTLFRPFWRSHHLNSDVGPTVTTMTGYGLGGPIQSIVCRPKQFALGSIDLPPPVTRLSLQKAGAFARSDYAGGIGMGVLKRFIVSFDYPHRMMWLLKSARFDAPDQYDRSGIWLSISNENDLSVLYVAEKSPAAEAGLEVGDKIDEVNTDLANPNTLFAIRKVLSDPGLQDVVVRVHRGETIKTFRIALRNQIAPAG